MGESLLPSQLPPGAVIKPKRVGPCCVRACTVVKAAIECLVKILGALVAVVHYQRRFDFTVQAGRLGTEEGLKY